MCTTRRNCCSCYRRYTYDPYYYWHLHSLRYPNNFLGGNSLAKISGTLNTICDGKENIIYDFFTPLSETVSVYNHGDCPAQVWIYYSEGVSIKRLGMIVDTGKSHKFDTISSVLRVTITCNPISSQCTNCNSNGTVDHCIVDYTIS